MKLTEDYYIALINQKGEKVKSKVKGRKIIIPNFESYLFFVDHSRPQKWNISEVITGRNVASGTSLKKTIAKCAQRLKDNKGYLDSCLAVWPKVETLPDCE